MLPYVKFERWLIPTLVLFATTVWVTAWAAGYPATMTPDSLDQWGQIASGRYSDWHPLAHTLLLRASLRLWASPGIMVLLQIVAMATLLAWGLILLRNHLRAPSWMLILTASFFAMHPAHAAMLSVLWKDIPYSLALAGFSLGLLQCYHQPDRPIGWFLLSLTALLCLLFRHNGLLSVVAGFVALGALRPAQFRAALLCLLAVLALAGGVRFSLRPWLHAAPAPITERLAIPLQQTAAIVAAGHPLSAEQSARLAAVLPLAKWRSNYDRYSVDALKFDLEFSSAPIQSDVRGFAGLWLGLICQNPATAFMAWLRQTMIMWDLRRDGQFTYPNGIAPNFLGLASTPLSIRLQTTWHRLYAFAAHAPWSWSTRPACFHLVLAGAALLCLRAAGSSALLPFTPLAAGLAGYCLFLPVPDFRYFYPGFILAPFLLIHTWACRQSARNNPPPAT